MAATLSQFKGAATNIGTGQTRNFAITSGGGSGEAAEANTQRTARAAGIYTTMTIRVTTNASDNTTTFFFRKNTANANQTLVFAAAETGIKSDITNSDSIISGDIINIQGINSGTGTLAVVGSCFKFTASTNTVQAYSFNAAGLTNSSGTTNYLAIGGEGSSTVQADREIKIGTIGTFKNMGIRVTVNTLDVTGSSTFVFLNNGVAGATTITFASAETGLKEDLVNSDIVAVNDLACIRQTNTGVSGSIVSRISWISLETTNNKTDYVSVANSTRIVAQSRFFDFIGNSGAQAFETNVPLIAQVGATLSNARAYVSANTWTANFIVNFRNNAANGNQTITFATTETGWKHDLVNTDTVVSSDAIDWQMTTSAGSGSVTTTNVVVTAEMAAVGGSTLLMMGCG